MPVEEGCSDPNAMEAGAWLHGRGRPGPQAQVDDLDLDSPYKAPCCMDEEDDRDPASDPDLDSPHKVARGCLASYSCRSPLEPLISGPGWSSGRHLAAPEAEGFESSLPLPACSSPPSTPLPAADETEAIIAKSEATARGIRMLSWFAPIWLCEGGQGEAAD